MASQTDGTNTINFTYDSNGSLEFMTLNGTKYAYESNAQGDIIGLLDRSNNEVVTYQYDTWGKLLNIGGSLASTVGVRIRSATGVIITTPRLACICYNLAITIRNRAVHQQG